MKGSRRFLFCSIVAKEGKRFLLIFPEGRGIQGGWSILANKLRFLGVILSSEARNGASPTKVWSGSREIPVVKTFVDAIRKDVGLVRDAIWLQLGENEVHDREELFRRCLVRWFGESPKPFLELSLLKLCLLNLW